MFLKKVSDCLFCSASTRKNSINSASAFSAYDNLHLKTRFIHEISSLMESKNLQPEYVQYAESFNQFNAYQVNL